MLFTGPALGRLQFPVLSSRGIYKQAQKCLRFGFVMFSESDVCVVSMQIPRTKPSTVGSHAFSVFDPSTWNDLALPHDQIIEKVKKNG